MNNRNEAQPAQPISSDAQPVADWRIDTGLVYSLNEHGANHNEINVSMANGSRGDVERNVMAQRIAAMLASPAPDVRPSLDKLDALQEEFDTLRAALEIIGVGDSSDPRKTAGEALVSIGFWKDTAPDVRVPDIQTLARYSLSEYSRSHGDWSAPDHEMQEDDDGGFVKIGDVRALLADVRPSVPVSDEQERVDECQEFDKWMHDRLFADPPQSVTPFDAWQARASHLQAAQPQEAGQVERLQRWASWILINRPEHFKDHACKRCVSHSDILVDGFSCVYHEAHDVVGGLAAAPAVPSESHPQQWQRLAMKYRDCLETVERNSERNGQRDGNTLSVKNALDLPLPSAPSVSDAIAARLQQIASLAQQGMCHGLLADDYCRQIAAIAAQSKEPKGASE